MKRHRSLSRQTLAIQVFEELRSVFRPSQVQVSKSIGIHSSAIAYPKESLIEREYIKRNSNDPKLIEYNP